MRLSLVDAAETGLIASSDNHSRAQGQPARTSTCQIAKPAQQALQFSKLRACTGDPGGSCWHVQAFLCSGVVSTAGTGPSAGSAGHTRGQPQPACTSSCQIAAQQALLVSKLRDAQGGREAAAGTCRLSLRFSEVSTACAGASVSSAELSQAQRQPAHTRSLTSLWLPGRHLSSGQKPGSLPMQSR